MADEQDGYSSDCWSDLGDGLNESTNARREAFDKESSNTFIQFVLNGENLNGHLQNFVNSAKGKEKISLVLKKSSMAYLASQGIFNRNDEVMLF